MEDRPNCKEKKIELASWGKLQSSVLVSETEQLQWWSCGLSFRPLDTAHCRNGQWHFLLPGISLSFSSSTCYHHSILSSWLTFFKKSVCLNILIKCISVCLIPMEARKGHWIPWNWSTEADLPMWVLRVEPSSSGRAANVLNHLTLLSSLMFDFLCIFC